MATIQELYDRGSGEAIYPKTITGAVIDGAGRDLETRLAHEADELNRTLGGYVTTEAMTEALGKKQDSFLTSSDFTMSGGVLRLVDAAKLALFIKLWDLAWGEYGRYDPDNAPDSEHVFMGNDLWMTADEAMEIYSLCISSLRGTLPTLYHRYYGLQLRTFLPICGNTAGEWHSCFRDNVKLEVLRVRPNVVLKEAYHTFFGCRNLTRVLGPFNCFQLNNSRDTFAGCTALEYIELYQLGGNVSFKDSPKLRIETFIYVNKNVGSSSSKGVTITVHPDVYAKLSGDTSNEAAAALTDEELTQWQQVCADAIAKNISFATV